MARRTHGRDTTHDWFGRYAHDETDSRLAGGITLHRQPSFRSPALMHKPSSHMQVDCDRGRQKEGVEVARGALCPQVPIFSHVPASPVPGNWTPNVALAVQQFSARESTLNPPKTPERAITAMGGGGRCSLLLRSDHLPIPLAQW